MSSKTAADAARRPWSVALRLTVWYAAAAFALVAVATAYQYWALARNMDREDDQYLADKVAEFRHVLDHDPSDQAALQREVSSVAGGRLLVRLDPGDGSAAVESPGMAGLLPAAVFPRPNDDPPVGDARAA